LMVTHKFNQKPPENEWFHHLKNAYY
jgi:hypothetical protein